MSLSYLHVNLFLPYSIKDEDGRIIGIRDDATEDARKQYEEYERITNLKNELGLPIMV